jgi:hypothetical protein
MASFDMVPLMLQMMAAELISLREKVETQADAGVFTAPSSNGLMGLSTLVHPDDEGGAEPLGEVGPGENPDTPTCWWRRTSFGWGGRPCHHNLRLKQT